MSIFGNNILGFLPRRYPGQVGQIEANDGMPYAVTNMRDMVNLSRIQVIPAPIMPTQAMNLSNFTDYLWFGRDLAAVRLRDRYLQGETVATASVERRTPVVRFGEKLEAEHASTVGKVHLLKAVEAGDPGSAKPEAKPLSGPT